MASKKADATRLQKLLDREHSFTDARELRAHTVAVCWERVIRALKLPNGESFAALRVRRHVNSSHVEALGRGDGRSPVILPVVLSVLRSGLRRPAEPTFRKAARDLLDLAIKRSGTHQDWTKAHLRFELLDDVAGLQDWYEVERTRSEVTITEGGAVGPTEAGRADTRKLVHLICERGVLCGYRGCNRRGEDPCPQRDLGCTREASDETVAALSRERPKICVS